MKTQIFEINAYKTIGIVFYGKAIGDSLAMSSMLKPLHDSGFSVYVFCSNNTAFMFNKNKYVDQCITTKKDKIKYLKNNKLNIDLLIDLSYCTLSDYNRMLIKKITKPKYSIFVYLHVTNEKEPSLEELTTVHNEVINYKLYDKHCTYIFKTILERIGIKTSEELEYYCDLDKNNLLNAKNFIDKLNDKKIIIFNPYANKDDRSFSTAQSAELLSFLSCISECQVILIGKLEKLNNIAHVNNVVRYTSDDIFDTVALLSMSNLIISVDTSIVHFSRAFNKKLICIYNNIKNGQFDNNKNWSPFYDRAIQLFSPTKKIEDFDVSELKYQIKKLL